MQESLDVLVGVFVLYVAQSCSWILHILNISAFLQSVAHVIAAALHVDEGVPLQHLAVRQSHALLVLAD